MLSWKQSMQWKKGLIEVENINQFVVFRVGIEEYAIPILRVNEIIRLKGVSITKVPNTKKEVIGIINLRGEVIPIIDFRLKFNIGGARYAGDRRGRDKFCMEALA